MKLTGIKTSPVNQGQKSSKKEQARKTMQDIGDKMPMKDKLVGGAGAFGIIGRGGLIGKIASRFLGKASKTVSKVAKSPSGKTIPGGGGTYGKPNAGNLKGTGSSRGGKVNEIIGDLGKALNK